MKFMTAFIKHSLQPSRKATTESLQNLPASRMQPAVSLDTNDMNAETPPTLLSKDTRSFIDETTNSNHYSTASSESLNPSFNNQISQQIEPEEMEFSTQQTIPEVDIIDGVIKEEFRQQPDTALNLSSNHNDTLTARQFDTENQPEQMIETQQYVQNHLINTLTVDDKTPEKTLKNSPVTESNLHTDNIKPGATITHEPVDPTKNTASNIAQNLVEQQQDIRAPETQRRNKEENDQEFPVTQPIYQQAVAATQKKRSTATQNFRPGLSTKQQKTPQVRIGNINILIDDQAAAKPVQKSTSKTTAPSIPFGLRGL